jgi:hypothetical protein
VTPEELRAATVSSRPVGYFSAVRDLLDRAVTLQIEIFELGRRERLAKLGSPDALALAREQGEKLAELEPLWELLHLAPGQRGMPAPRASNVIPLRRHTACSDGARRQRAFRQRQRRGQIILKIPVDEVALGAALLAARHVAEPETLSRPALERGAATVLSQWAQHWIKKP